jgi:hypothetical protein
MTKKRSGTFIERAFIETAVFLEAAGLPETLSAVKDLQQEAAKNYAATGRTEDGGLYPTWSARLGQYLDAIQTTFGEPDAQIVTKDLVDILRATQYAITDRECFGGSPVDEKEVHARIEAVPRCVFPDLVSKPAISKPIKNFQPDTGLPDAHTLIEYKFISSREDAKRVADQVLADTRGYHSPEWNKFVYVIYETKRITPERQWVDLLRKSAVNINTSIVVLSGEEPRLPKQRNKPKSRKRSHRSMSPTR